MIPEDHAIDVEYDLIAIVDGLPQKERGRVATVQKFGRPSGG